MVYDAEQLDILSVSYPLFSRRFAASLRPLHFILRPEDTVPEFSYVS